MAIATLEYDLSDIDDAEDFRTVQKADKYKRAIEELYTEARSMRKYEEHSKEVLDAVERLLQTVEDYLAD